jgi:hypothetical protein
MMKTLCLLLFALVAEGLCHATGALPQTGARDHKPCVDPEASPASDEDTAVFQQILSGLNIDLRVFLYVSDDPIVRQFGGGMSFRCAVDDHQLYETYENWTIYDPKLVQGDAARDFIFAHEIAHHLNGDTSSGQPRSERMELRADYNGAKFLLRLGWKEARLLHALELLNLPQGTQAGYPTAQERRKNIEDMLHPSGPPAPPTGLQATVTGFSPKELMAQLLKAEFGGPVKLQSVRTSRYVCARGTPDSRIPSTRHFEFFDNCDDGARVTFDLRIGAPGNSGYWFEQREEPCPDFAENCTYALESVGNQLQFWNQNLGADRSGWEKELGDQELFHVEAVNSSGETIRIRLHAGSYIVVDPKTGKLQGGGSQEQAAEFKPVPGS